MRALPHPDCDQIDLALVLEALSDPTRLAIVVRLDDDAEPEQRCGDFHEFGTKSNLAYHFAKLRSAGAVRTRVAGTSRHMSLRRADLDSRFPGLLDMIISAARASLDHEQKAPVGPRRKPLQRVARR